MPHLFDEVKTDLIVFKVDIAPINFLAVVLSLLHLEDVLVKELLQFLVSVVDAHLLKAIFCKAFETKDIEYSNERRLLLVMAQSLVDADDEEVKQAAVDGLGERISCVRSLFDLARDRDELETSLYSFAQDAFGDFSHAELEEVTSSLKNCLRSQRRRVFISSFKHDVADVQQRSKDPVDDVLLGVGQSNNLHGDTNALKLLRVRNPLHLCAVTLIGVVEIVRGPQLHRLFLLLCCTRKQLVEDVIVALILRLENEPRLLQQIVLDHRTDDLPTDVELKLHELTKTRRIVVSKRLGVTKRLENRIRLQDLLLNVANAHRTAHVCEIRHADLRRFCLSSARLSADNDRLAQLVAHHRSVGSVRDCKSMR